MKCQKQCSLLSTLITKLMIIDNLNNLSSNSKIVKSPPLMIQNRKRILTGKLANKIAKTLVKMLVRMTANKNEKPTGKLVNKTVKMLVKMIGDKKEKPTGKLVNKTERMSDKMIGSKRETLRDRLTIKTKGRKDNKNQKKKEKDNLPQVDNHDPLTGNQLLLKENSRQEGKSHVVKANLLDVVNLLVVVNLQVEEVLLVKLDPQENLQEEEDPQESLQEEEDPKENLQVEENPQEEKVLQENVSHLQVDLALQDSVLNHQEKDLALLEKDLHLQVEKMKTMSFTLLMKMLTLLDFHYMSLASITTCQFQKFIISSLCLTIKITLTTGTTSNSPPCHHISTELSIYQKSTRYTTLPALNCL